MSTLEVLRAHEREAYRAWLTSGGGTVLFQAWLAAQAALNREAMSRAVRS